MLNVWKFLKTPRRNHGENEATTLAASPSALPFQQALSPFCLSPNPKRRNTNPSPGKTMDDKHQNSDSGDVQVLNAVTDTIHHGGFCEPPQLHSTAFSESMLFPSQHLVPTYPLQKVVCNLRTQEQVAKQRMTVLQGLEFPAGMPRGPCKSYQELYEAINKWAKDPNTSGGSFTVKKDSTNAATKNRGPSQKIVCSRGGCSRARMVTVIDNIENADERQKQQRDQQQPSTIIGCPWEIWTEESTAGWVITNPTKKCIQFAMGKGKDVCLWHNHKLVETLEERLAFSTMREIPKQIEEFATNLDEAGCMTPSQIYTALVAKCRRDNIEITFNQSDIKNKYGTTHGESILDCTNLVQHLKERQLHDNELEYAIWLDGSNGHLDRVFFVLKQGKAIWKRSKGAVLLFDTKHGTNRYGLKLGCFVTIDERGKTRVLASSFVRSEDEASFTWTFKNFQDSFQSSPVVLFTDSDAAMAAATKGAWPNTIHLLCTFHLWKNFWEHIRPLFFGKGDNNAWQTISDLWWRLCKTSDECERACFDDKFDALVSLIQTNANATDAKLNKQLTWLSSLHSRKEQWAACYTWKHRTYGIHSTQRAEAIHSAISQFCSKGSTILGITMDLEQMADMHTLKNNMNQVTAMLRGTITQSFSLLPGLERTASNLESFPRIMMNAQAALLIKYDCNPLGDDDTVPNDEKSFLVVPTNVGETTKFQLCDPMENGSMFSDHDGFNQEVDHGITLKEDRVKCNGHTTTLKKCSCQFPILWGLPCRHMLSE